jgi:two-component system, NarL family, sensor histidine kinase LiaS
MSLCRVYFYYFASLALFISLIVVIAFGTATGHAWYQSLWATEVFSIPLILFLLGICLFISGLFGWFVSNTMKKKLEEVNYRLFQFENGTFTPSTYKEEIEEFNHIWKRLDLLQQRLEEQIKSSQKMASERAEWHEQMKQEVVSQERHRLARELHDSVSQQLFAASMLLSAVNQQQSTGITNEKSKNQLALVEDIVTQAQSEMRALLLHLRPVQLEGKSLKSGMDELLKELAAKHPMNLNWHVENVNLEKGVEDHLFRIVQEAISNTLRHAKAKSLEVRLVKINPFVLLKIVDDGIGFSLDKQKVGSYGLKSIQERVTEIGGTVKIISLPNKGTSLEVKVPIIEKKDDHD